jgi:nucleotide-binding universal stress UspA family protein
MLPTFNTILLAAGMGEDTRFLFNYALSLAQKYSARIEVVHGHEVPDLTSQQMAEIYMFQESLSGSYDKSLEENETRLQAQLELICQAEIDRLAADRTLLAGVRIVRKSAKLAILETAAELGADLIVMGSHRHSVLTDALLGSTTMKILHSATTPVLVVRLPRQPAKGT